MRCSANESNRLVDAEGAATDRNGQVVVVVPGTGAGPRRWYSRGGLDARAPTARNGGGHESTTMDAGRALGRRRCRHRLWGRPGARRRPDRRRAGPGQGRPRPPGRAGQAALRHLGDPGGLHDQRPQGMPGAVENVRKRIIAARADLGTRRAAALQLDSASKVWTTPSAGIARRPPPDLAARPTHACSCWPVRACGREAFRARFNAWPPAGDSPSTACVPRGTEPSNPGRSVPQSAGVAALWVDNACDVAGVSWARLVGWMRSTLRSRDSPSLRRPAGFHGQVVRSVRSCHDELVGGCDGITCPRLGAWGSGNAGGYVRCWRACGVVASPSRPISGGRGRSARGSQWSCPRLGRGRSPDTHGGRGAGRPSTEQPTHHIPDGWFREVSRWRWLHRQAAHQAGGPTQRWPANRQDGDGRQDKPGKDKPGKDKDK